MKNKEFCKYKMKTAFNMNMNTETDIRDRY